jgi:hypothetical protein
MTLIGGVPSNDYLHELLDFVRSHDLENAVSIEPATDDPYAVLAAHDMCVVPSTNEPSSRVMVEAMLVGTAVVASDIGGNVEKAGGERRAAVLYPLGDPAALADCLRSLLGDPGELREQAARGHAYAVERYVEQDQLAPLLAGLEEICEQPAPAPGTWLVDALVERSAELKRVRATVQAMSIERDDAVAARERGNARAADLEAQIARLTAQVRELEGLVNMYSTSRSWRMTEPARALGRGARRVIGGARRPGG